MRPFVVVEVDDAADDFLGLASVFRPSYPVEPFLLDYPIHTFGYGIVRGAIVLSHAYACVYGIEQPDVCVAAVLRASVGVMDEMV